jgi:hypothetical protein
MNEIETLLIQSALTMFILLMYVVVNHVYQWLDLRPLSPIERVILKDFTNMMRIIVSNDWDSKSLGWKLGKMKEIIDYIEQRRIT